MKPGFDSGPNLQPWIRTSCWTKNILALVKQYKHTPLLVTLLSGNFRVNVNNVGYTQACIYRNTRMYPSLPKSSKYQTRRCFFEPPKAPQEMSFGGVQPPHQPTHGWRKNHLVIAFFGLQGGLGFDPGKSEGKTMGKNKHHVGSMHP